MSPKHSEKRDEVLKRLLETPPKPRGPTKEELDALAEEFGQNDPNADFGSEA